MTDTKQNAIRLGIAPSAGTVDRLFTIFGDEMIPAEEVRQRYYRNMNADTFKAALGTDKIPLPVSRMTGSNKAIPHINIRHLAAYIEQRAYLADQELACRLNPGDQPS